MLVGSVSVILVTHNSLPILDICLDSLLVALSEIDAELIVIDNDSNDNSPTIVARKYPEARILTNRDNRGFAVACNQGAKIAKKDFLLFLNPDAIVDSDAISNLLNVYAENQRIGLAVGRLRSPDGRYQPCCRRFPTISNLISSHGSILWRLGIVRGSEGKYTQEDCKSTTIVEAVSGTMTMIKRQLFEKMNGFDERFFMYVEDTDISLRVQQAGYVNVFVPTAGAVHYRDRGGFYSRARRSLYHHRSIWKYFSKHGSSLSELILLVPILGVNLVLSLLIPPGRTGHR